MASGLGVVDADGHFETINSLQSLDTAWATFLDAVCLPFDMFDSMNIDEFAKYFARNRMQTVKSQDFFAFAREQFRVYLYADKQYRDLTTKSPSRWDRVEEHENAITSLLKAKLQHHYLAFKCLINLLRIVSSELYFEPHEEFESAKQWATTKAAPTWAEREVILQTYCERMVHFFALTGLLSDEFDPRDLSFRLCLDSDELLTDHDIASNSDIIRQWTQLYDLVLDSVTTIPGSLNCRLDALQEFDREQVQMLLKQQLMKLMQQGGHESPQGAQEC